MSQTRTVQFDVAFAGLREADRLDLYRQVWGSMDDLVRAQTRLASCLHQIGLGHLEPPTITRVRKGPHQGESHVASMKDLSYRGLSGSWQPYGRPLYEPSKGPKLASGVLLAASGDVLSRIETDMRDIMRGDKALVTFRSASLPCCPNNGSGFTVSLQPSGAFLVRLSLFSLPKNKVRRVSLVPVGRIDADKKSVLAKIVDGTYKVGDAVLKFHQRKTASGRRIGRGRWRLSISWTDKAHVLPAIPALQTPEPLRVAGINLGITNAVWLSSRTEAPVSKTNCPSDVLHFNRTAVRAVARIYRERSERGKTNRKEHGLRTGRGRTRKFRSLDGFGDKIRRIISTEIEHLCATTARVLRLRGIEYLGLEELTGWSLQQMQAEADASSTLRDAASLRRWYRLWHQGGMRDQLRSVMTREGVTVVDVPPDSRGCAKCGARYDDVGVYDPDPKPGHRATFGRVTWHEFRCSCGWEVHADHNAALNAAGAALAIVTGRAPVHVSKDRRPPANTSARRRKERGERREEGGDGLTQATVG